MPARLLSFATGFLSLSIEILWIRLFSYANHSLPQSFSFVLIFYLIGIAVGAYIGKFFCKPNYNLWVISGITLFLASLTDIMSPWIYVNNFQQEFYLGAFLITLSALLKAIVFPIAHHIGTLDNSNNVSKIYVANIFGSSIGPVITGCLFLSIFSTQQTFIIIASLSFILALWCLRYEVNSRFVYASSLTALLLVGVLWTVNPHQLLTPLGTKDYNVHRIVENQYGIIATYYGGSHGDYIMGGNVYDGRTNLNPAINSNGINRVLILPALQAAPKKVLLIGLSIGTWLKLVTGFPNVEQIDVVEINPGYLKAIADYPEQQSALNDPKVKLYFDDGRRWLKSHPNNQYDLIVMNTTYYWRSYSSNLLSQEFLKLIRTHMDENAILAFNSTDSPDALNTAAHVFKNAYLYQNFVIAADFDWREKLKDPSAINKISQISLDGTPLFGKEDTKLIQRFIGLKLKTNDDVKSFYEGFGRKVEIVTDRNLITEYKYGKSLSYVPIIPW